MKNLSKALSLILACIMTFSCFAVSGYAVATPLEAGNSMETAVNIPEYDVTYVSTLSVAGEVDWFKFTTKSEDAYYYLSYENYNIPVSNMYNGSTCLNFYLYDGYNKQLLHDWLQENKTNASQNIKLEPDTTYFIKVLMGNDKKDSTGNYTLNVSYKYDDAPNTMEESKNISFNDKIISSLDGTKDNDWYTFTTGAVKANYTFDFVNYNIPIYRHVNGDNCLNLHLYNSDGQELKHIWLQDDAMSQSFTVELEADSEYYFNILMGSGRDWATGNYEITVKTEAPKPVELTGIAYITLPKKTSYNVGESFDKTGLTISAQYSDGSSKLISTYTISGFDSSTAGIKTIVVTYSENGIAKSCKFTVSVLAVKSLIAVNVASAPTKTTYQLNEAFDATGLIINAVYDNGTTSFVTDYTISDFDSTTAGTKTMIVTYTENGITKSCTFDVIVQEPDDGGNFFLDAISAIISFFTSIIDFIIGIFG